ncbi:hypothetical protein [Rhizobium alvei]|uniref:Uncharacterized protein n=1 Tax=Rhizobium alvei TaxID=1132659 RepID=A0ABT8YUJ2_9HYPH|nr:hypothetical protein [Rhizobium alvei]MDO6966967.1 hypothetical protein [Rhizobium alvei]
MTDNVIDLRPEAKERLIYLCVECGCSTFYMYSDGTTECAACNGLDAGGEWVTKLESQPKSPEKTDAGSFSVTCVGSPELARERVVKNINTRKGELALLGGWFEDGSVSLWDGAEDDDQNDWLINKLREAADHLDMRKVNPDDDK